MIVSFHCKETEKVFAGDVSQTFPADIQATARRKLRMVAAAVNINDMRQPPGNRLEKLEGDRQGQYSIRINDQWRICFSWEDGGAHEVEITKHYD